MNHQGHAAHILNIAIQLPSLIKGFFAPTFRIAQHALGKYIIAQASILHLIWAALLIIDKRSGNATPVAILFQLLQNDRLLVIFILVVVAALAGCFLDLRIRQKCNVGHLTLLLIPQQIVLCISAGAGITAAITQQYADGINRCWAHILADQLPVILMAVLYTAAVLETRLPPFPLKLPNDSGRV